MLMKGFPGWTWVEKTVHGVKTHWLSSNEKVLDAVKKIVLTILSLRKGCIDIDLLASGASVNSVAFAKPIRNILPYTLNDCRIPNS